MLLPFVFPLLFVFACEESQVESVVDAPAVEQKYVQPRLPKDGVVLEEPMVLEQCLTKVPSCACIGLEEDALCYPQFYANILPLPRALKESMKDTTWTPDCPITQEDLMLLRVLHWNEKKQIQWGEMILSKNVVSAAREVFFELYQLQFPIHSIKPAVYFDGSDEDSMAENNSSGFNCRKVKGTNRWSEHSYGEAIDINPLWNPWVQGLIIYPENGRVYTDRSNVIPGMINKGDEIITIFERNGWRWGSKKKNVKDYQHFSRIGHQE